jgi:hypothetical protein
MNILCMVSAPPPVARPHLERILAQHPGARFTFYVRQSERAQLDDLLEGHEVRSDKPGYRLPGHGRVALVRDLRAEKYDLGMALGLGHWTYWPQKLAFALARARRKVVLNERGEFLISWWRPWTLFHHFQWRLRNPVGSVAGMPAGTPMALPAAIYRKTVGLVLGVLWTTLEYGFRRVF